MKSGGKYVKGGASGGGGILDGSSVVEMSREQLEPFVLRIQKELEREREERNFFQVERNKIKTFWEITRQQLQDCQSRLRIKDDELEKVEKKYEERMMIFQQKLKHLMYEYQTMLSQLKIENIIFLKHSDEKFVKKEEHLIRDKNALRFEIIHQKMLNADRLKLTFLESDKITYNLRNDFEHICRNLEEKYRIKRILVRYKLRWEKEAQILQSQEREHNHLKELKTLHRKIRDSISTLHSDIIRSNVTLISVLKNVLKIMKEENDRMKIEIYMFKEQNIKLVKTLNESKLSIMKVQSRLAARRPSPSLVVQ